MSTSTAVKSLTSLATPMAPPIAAVCKATCLHCGLDMPLGRIASQELFCCRGCQTVYHLIQSSGLGKYYRLKTSPNKTEAEEFNPDELIQQYAQFDRPEWRDAQKLDKTAPQLRFYLEGVHCTACLWLLEKLGELCPDVAQVRMDLERSTLWMTLKKEGRFAPACALLTQLGYRPHLLSEEIAAVKQEQENREMAIRIAIAGACTGNVMLMSVALYAGVEGPLATVFRLLMIALSLPAYLYSAVPFYKSAWSALLTRSISIDVPIVVALWAGLVSGIYQAYLGTNEIYLDSLVGLIFLLLGSRYFLRRLSLSQLQGAGILSHVTPATSLLFETQTPVLSQSLKTGQWVVVHPGEFFSCDGIVKKGQSSMNNALLSGESDPVALSLNDTVYAGAKNLENTLVIEVSAPASQSRLAQLSAQLLQLGETTTRTRIVNLSDQAAQYFVATVMALAFLILGFFVIESNPIEGFRRAMSLIIIACPCALALATPFTYAKAHQWAARFGIVLKSPQTLENIPHLTDLLLDKTGTLTEGKPLLQKTIATAGNENRVTWIKKIIYVLEKESRHPIAKSFIKEFENDPEIFASPLPHLEHIQEMPGVGVSAYYQGADQKFYYEIKQSTLGVVLLENQKPLAHFEFKDQVRADTLNAIKQLQTQFPKLQLHLLSGDRTESVTALSKHLNIKTAQAQVTPQEKLETIERLQKQGKKVMMVGDGANDALALKAADIGVAVHGGMELSLQASDLFLSQPGIQSLVHLFTLARETRHVLLRNFGISILYNIFGGGAALMGWISPLAAAIIMPVSAFTVFMSCQWGTRSLRNLKELK